MNNLARTQPTSPATSNVLAGSRTWLMRLMAECLATWFREEIPEPTQMLHLRAWQETVDQVGPQAFERAIRTAMRTRKFFPQPGDIEELVEDEPERPNLSTYIPPTAEELGFRDSDEQRKAHAEFKRQREALCKRMPQAPPRPYIPTCAELAAELAETEHIRHPARSE